VLDAPRSGRPRHGIVNTATTVRGFASGTKGFTRLRSCRSSRGSLHARHRPVRSVLGDVLELIDARVTVGHLLAHTSGIGDYSTRRPSTTSTSTRCRVRSQLAARRLSRRVERASGRSSKRRRPFEYCNGGYVVLTLVAEAVRARRASTTSRAERVFAPAGMSATGSALGRAPRIGGVRVPPERQRPADETAASFRSALGRRRAYSTWATSPRSGPHCSRGASFRGPRRRDGSPAQRASAQPSAYGSGSGIRPDRDTPMLEGYDAGVSFRSASDPPPVHVPAMVEHVGRCLAASWNCSTTCSRSRPLVTTPRNP